MNICGKTATNHVKKGIVRDTGCFVDASSLIRFAKFVVFVIQLQDSYSSHRMPSM